MTLSKLPSLETLAVELNIPSLLKLSSNGHTSESISQMKFNEAEKNGISTEEYMRLKAYFNKHKSQSVALRRRQQLTLDAHRTTDPDNVPLSQLMPIAAPAMPYYQQQPGAVQYKNMPQPRQREHVSQQTSLVQTEPTIIVVDSPISNETIAWSVVGGVVISFFVSPTLGLCGLPLLGSKRQRGAWLLGLGSGGLYHSIAYYIIGGIFLDYSNEFVDNTRNWSYKRDPVFYNYQSNVLRSIAIALFVVGSIHLIACILETAIGTILVKNKKIGHMRNPLNQQPQSHQPLRQPGQPGHSGFQPVASSKQYHSQTVSSVSNESIAFGVMGASILSTMFSPIVGLFGYFLKNKQQWGAWLIGSGIGGLAHCIPYFIAGGLISPLADQYDNDWSNYISSSASSWDPSPGQYYKAMDRYWRSMATALVVVRSFLFVITIINIVVGRRLLKSIKTEESAAKVPGKNTA